MFAPMVLRAKITRALQQTLFKSLLLGCSKDINNSIDFQYRSLNEGVKEEKLWQLTLVDSEI